MTKARDLGERITAFRERLGLSLDQLAQNSSVNSALLGAIEAGDAYPALGVLIKLARALGQRVGTFTDDHFAPDPLIVRAKDRQLGSRQHLGNAGGTIQYFSLGQGKTDRHMEPLYIEISPEEPVNLTSHEGEEFLIALSGQLVIHYGQECYTLEAGDSAYYNSVVPHSVSAGGGQTATAYAVVYQPS